MTHTARLTVIAQRFVELFTAKVGDETFFNPPLQDVYYGDQIKIPRSPTLCVEPAQKVRTWPPTPTLMSENTFEINFFIYHARVDGTQVVKLESDQFGEAVEEFINMNHVNLADSGGNQIIIHGNVVESEPGYSFRNTGRDLYHSTRLLWRGISKTRLLVAG